MSLNEVFDSFKENELEFETYLRPLMQDVIRESEPLNDERKSERAWDKETWFFLQKSILNNNKVTTDFINTFKRNKRIAKLIKLRQQQMKLQRDTERHQQEEKLKFEEQRRLEEQASR